MRKLKRKYRNKPLPYYRRKHKFIKLKPNRFMEVITELILKGEQEWDID